MAEIHGKSGTVSFDGAQADVTNWTLNISAEDLDSTAMTDTYKTRLLGLIDWTATVTALIPTTGPAIGDNAALGDIGTSQTLALSDGTNTYSGTAFAQSFSVGNPVDGIPTITIQFEGSGALS